MADPRFGNVSGEGGKEWGHGTTWSAQDIELMQEFRNGSLAELRRMFPGRTDSSIRNAQARARYSEQAVPPVVPPGEYVHVLSDFLVDEFECMQIWCKWNGYATYREVSRDRYGVVTVVCQAK